MPRGRHRVEPSGRPLPRLRRPAAVVIGGALLGVCMIVSFSPDTGPGPAHQPVAVANEGRRDNAADVLRVAAAFRAEERTSRDRVAPPPPTAPVRRAHTHKERHPRPAVVAPSTSKPRPHVERTPPRASDAACSISPGVLSHLTSNARSVYRAVCAVFGRTVSAFGGYRPGDSGDHGSGRAVDIMVSGNPGWAVARYVQANAGELHVTYVIYQQKIWLAGRPTGPWRLMEDRGSRTANHYDHVHVSVS